MAMCSHDNLLKDYYLRSKMEEQGWVPIQIIADFNRVSYVSEFLKCLLFYVRDLHVQCE